MTGRHVVDTAAAHSFLAQRRRVVVGASDDPKSFGRTIYRALRAQGTDVVAVNSQARTVDAQPCYPDLAAVPGAIDGVIVMVYRDNRAIEVVRDCVERAVPRVWLFKGLGGKGMGAVSDVVVELCHEHGIEVIAGACPLMFLEPVGWDHRVHRSIRRRKGALAVTNGATPR